MESNISGVNNMDYEVCLPPRKRLLAGLKRQYSDQNAAAAFGLSSLACPPNDVTTHLNNVLGSHVNERSISVEEMDQVSRSAAAAAARAAEAARIAKSVADEKAAIAAKAIAAAKKALDLVATFPKDVANKERLPKKNKMKKHVPLQQLYRKHQKADNHRVDEELARKLHRAINSSPRICKKISSSDVRGLKNKYRKSLLSQRSRVPNGVVLLEGGQHSKYSRQAKVDEVGSGGSNHDLCSMDEDGKASEYEKPGQLVAIAGEAESSHSGDKTPEETPANGKKKGKAKLKKLPLSICNYRDGANTKSEMCNNGSPMAGSASMFPQEQAGNVMPVEATSMWKCQDFKAAACVNKNKVM